MWWRSAATRTRRELDSQLSQLNNGAVARTSPSDSEIWVGTDSRPTRVRSVSRAIQILVFVAASERGRSSSEVATELRVPVPTVYHLLNTLADEGALSKHDRRFHLGPTIGLLADAFLQENAEPPFMMTPLRELARKTEETVYLCGWRHGEIRILATIEGARAVRVVGLGTGVSGQAHARASGKLLLAQLEDAALDAYLATHGISPLTPKTIVTEEALREELASIRINGYAVDSEEFMDGVSCVSAPIRHGATVLATIGLSAPSERFERNRERYVREVLAAARSAESSASEQREVG